MSEQEKGGVSGVAVAGGVAAGAGTAYLGVKHRTANEIGRVLEGSEKANKELAASVDSAFKANPALKAQSGAVNTLKGPGVIEGINDISFAKATGENAKGYVATIKSSPVVAEGQKAAKTVTTRLNIDALPKQAQGAEGAINKMTADGVKELKGSWAAKATNTAERGVMNGLRGSEAVKSAGGVWGKVSGGGKARVVLVSAAAATAVGLGLNAMFNKDKSHTGDIAERGASAGLAR